MIEIKLFDLKNEMIKNKETILDFTENNFKVNYLDPNIVISKILLIEERHLCRPDLICFEGYGNLNHIDAILKFNQITNPFSMELYDVIVFPSTKSINSFYRKDKKTKEIVKDTKSFFIDPSRASEKDKNRIEQLKKIANKRKNRTSEPKPTNLLRPGEKPFFADGNNLIFAPSISTPRKLPQ